MAYKMYLGGVLMPITPSKVTVKINNQNKTMTLINGEEINILKAAGLSDVSFELLLPQVPYPFTNGGMFFYTNLTVGMENYEITDDAGAGFDVKVKVNLKQYKAYGTKTVTIKQPATPAEPPKATVQEAPRPTATAPKTTTYTVKSGDCLWNIAKKYLGDGSRYTEIYNLNKDKIKNPNLIYPNQVLTLPS